MIVLDLNHVAGVIVRAEERAIRHNTGLQGRMVIDCGGKLGARNCTIRVYSRSHDRLKARVNVSWKLTSKHRTRIFEDYSGWAFDSSNGRTYLISNDDDTKLHDGGIAGGN